MRLPKPKPQSDFGATATRMSWVAAGALAAPFTGCGESGPCGEGMVPIPSTEAAVFCIDAFEATVQTTGKPDGTSVSTAVSKRGVPPTEGITWTAAGAVCASTPAGGPAAQPAFKHLATAQEWEDAGDGVVGAGGTRFPWGEADVSGRCYLPGVIRPGGPGEPGASQAVPTGSFRECKSNAGVYDQLGNVWEWVNPGETYDHAGAVAAAIQAGTVFSPEGRVLFTGAHVEAQWTGRVRLIPDITGLWAEFPAEEHGPPGQVRPEVGWLTWGTRRASGDPQHRLAVRFMEQIEMPGAPPSIAVFADPTHDGQPFTEKRGGAYYAGADADLRFGTRAHRPDFFGTIGFRCASAPFPPP